MYRNNIIFFFIKLVIQLLKEGMIHNNDFPNVNDIFELIFHVKIHGILGQRGSTLSCK